MSKDCVVIQGPTHDQERMSKAWEGFNVIYSTWDDEKPKGEIPNNFVYNEKPKDAGFRNINYQVTSTLSGLKKAKKDGFDFCLKWRSDYVPSNATNLFKMFDKKALNFIAWSNHDGGYLIDYFFAGKTDYLIQIFEKMRELEKTCQHNFPEQKLTMATRELVEKKCIKPNYLLNKFDDSNYCTFIRPGDDYNTSNVVWQKDLHWQNDLTEGNRWA
tara:strand:- start:264 stop:908 length:645 start_codon:yes stop_codon:yes gene_type:complete